MSPEKVTYSFVGIDQQDSSCQLIIYRRPNFDVVIVENSESEDETLAIKRLQSIAEGATDQYKLDPDRTCWLAHTPKPLDLLGEFRKIPLQNQREGLTLPRPGMPWSYLSRSEVEKMIGTTIEPT